MTDSQLIGRFAPSPTGRMHAGNIFSALICWLIVRAQNGRIVLRIEDLDRERSRQEYADRIMSDLEALGLTWDEGPFYQHDRSDIYAAAFDTLAERELIYPCFCTRAEIHAASAPHQGEYSFYPGTCRHLTKAQQVEKMAEKAQAGSAPSYRIKTKNKTFYFDDLIQGEQAISLRCGQDDFAVKRSDGGFAYQLAVIVDDADQGVNCVVRGCDLLRSTPKQMLLQQELLLPKVQYAHVPLFVDREGRRLAKRNKDAEYGALLASLGSPQAVLGNIAYSSGLIPEEVPITPDELLQNVSLADLLNILKEKEAVLYNNEITCEDRSCIEIP